MSLNPGVVPPVRLPSDEERRLLLVADDVGAESFVRAAMQTAAASKRRKTLAAARAIQAVRADMNMEGIAVMPALQGNQNALDFFSVFDPRAMRPTDDPNRMATREDERIRTEGRSAGMQQLVNDDGKPIDDDDDDDDDSDPSTQDGDVNDVETEVSDDAADTREDAPIPPAPPAQPERFRFDDDTPSAPERPSPEQERDRLREENKVFFSYVQALMDRLDVERQTFAEALERATAEAAQLRQSRDGRDEEDTRLLEENRRRLEEVVATAKKEYETLSEQLQAALERKEDEMDDLRAESSADVRARASASDAEMRRLAEELARLGGVNHDLQTRMEELRRRHETFVEQKKREEEEATRRVAEDIDRLVREGDRERARTQARFESELAAERARMMEANARADAARTETEEARNIQRYREQQLATAEGERDRSENRLQRNIMDNRVLRARNRLLKRRTVERRSIPAARPRRVSPPPRAGQVRPPEVPRLPRPTGPFSDEWLVINRLDPNFRNNRQRYD